MLAKLVPWCGIVIILATLAACSGDGKAERATIEIAVVPKGTTHDFWRSIHAGAVKAARELGVNVVFRGPEREDDRASQIALIENFVAGKISAMVVAPLDDQALVAPIRLASGRGIPVVIIDSALKGEVGKDYASFVATDNEKGGEMAGEHLAKILGGKGRVLILRYQEGSASTVAREAGFVGALKRYPGIELVDTGRYAGPTRDTAQTASENLLDSVKDIRGIFCPNESSTFGMLLALKSRKMNGKVRFVGFDTSPGLVSGLEEGDIDGLVAQNPMQMGYLGVKTVVAALKKESVEPVIDTGAALVTKESMSTPEHAALLHPDLDTYLGGR